MPRIPQSLRQQDIPGGFTIRRPQLLPLHKDPLTKNLKEIGNFLNKTTDEMFKAEVSSVVNSAEISADLSLKELELKLSKDNPSAAVGNFEIEQRNIYNNLQNKFYSPQMKLQFNRKWQALSSKARLSVTNTAHKRRFKELEGNLMSDLDVLTKGLTHKNPVSGITELDMTPGGAVKTHLIQGLNIINSGEANGILNPVKAQKLRQKYVKDYQSNVVQQYINTESFKNPDNIYKSLITTGKLPDLEIDKIYQNLSPKQRDRFKTEANQNYREYHLAKQRIKSETEKKDRESIANEIKLFSSKLKKDQRTFLDIARKSKFVSFEKLRLLTDIYNKRTDQANDPNEEQRILEKILTNPNTVSFNEIQGSQLLSTQAIKRLKAKKIAQSKDVLKFYRKRLKNLIQVPVGLNKRVLRITKRTVRAARNYVINELDRLELSIIKEKAQNNDKIEKTFNKLIEEARKNFSLNN